MGLGEVASQQELMEQGIYVATIHHYILYTASTASHYISCPPPVLNQAGQCYNILDIPVKMSLHVCILYCTVSAQVLSPRTSLGLIFYR